MASFDSIVIGEDWISEHYFTTDSAKESFHGKVLELRKMWDAEKKAGRDTVRDRLLSAANDLQTALGGLAENPDSALNAHALIRETFGYPTDLSEFAAERAGTELLIPACQLAGISNVLFLQAIPVSSIDDLLDPDTGLLISPAVEDGKPIESASKAVSAAFRSDTPPAFVVAQAGQWLLLAEAERWAEGRYLAVDLLVVVERRHEARGGEIDRVAAIFGSQTLLPDADGNIWWTGVLEDSVKHTVGVSKDLREGIRLSIEIMANEVVRRRAAQGLSLDGVDGQDLAKHSLRFLYRILFLLYAEASPEMCVLPTGAEEYEEGYGLDRLRDLTLTELGSEQARTGTHLYESLARLFQLVDRGHSPTVREDIADDPAPGLDFQPLRADLFKPEATALIDEVGLGNEATQRVLEHLLLSKESKGRKGPDRGFISYAELGINQLGAVYEGLMSYTGFFAEEDLYEVAKSLDKEGRPDKGSWVVPVSRSDHLASEYFVPDPDDTSGQGNPVIHEKGTFVFRLAGRERQQSASYYTPEVLTKFVVSQALEELLDQNNERTTPERILQLSICEPALGSGAFAIEAVRQLAAEYLKRKQEDLGELIDADQYPIELQKVKAHIALHQVYGVDLNATAVELAEISLWLDTMVAGLQAPWFGLHLRRGNSLIGARRSVYAPTLLTKKLWLKTPAKDVPLDEEIGAGIHHFLLPSEGWGAVIDTAEAKTYAPDEREELRLWRNEIRKSPSRPIAKRLQALARRVETLWAFTLRRLTIAESEIRRDTDLWGSEALPQQSVAVTREQIERALHDENGAYRRLRRAMDAWCAIWSWPLTTDIDPPDWDQWVGGLEALLGVQPKADKFEKLGQASFSADMGWEELDTAEDIDRGFAQARPIDDALQGFPWLRITAGIADAQGFFHWELDFAPVLATGGFDLQVGNPPWVRPDWDENSVLAEYDPWFAVTDSPAPEARRSNRETLLANPAIRNSLLDLRSSQFGSSAHLGSPLDYKLLSGQHSNLYRSFIERTWYISAPAGIVALIHTDNHLNEPSYGELRRQCYRRLRRHWEFRNQLKLFDIGNTRPYSVNVYGSPMKDPNFLHAALLFHPDTVVRSLCHDGRGDSPGIKDMRDCWSQEPHRDRILRVDRSILQSWAALIDPPGTSALLARMVYSSSRSANSALARLAESPRMSAEHFSLTHGWTEGKDHDRGFYRRCVETPSSWNDAILQGPQISIANVLYQQTNLSARSHRDYESIDLELINENFVPRTRYQVAIPRDQYLNAYPRWNGKSSADFYRIIWRRRLDDAMERTVLAAVAPPGPCHVHQVMSGRLDSNRKTVVAAGIWASLPIDFLIKSAGFSDLVSNVVDVVPLVLGHTLEEYLIHRTMRLNCLTSNYSELWSELYSDEWSRDVWTARLDGNTNLLSRPLNSTQRSWSWQTPLRRAFARRLALVEIDAVVAVMLGISADELVALYHAQFPVLMANERSALFDASGRRLPTSLASEFRKKHSLKSARPQDEGFTYLEPFTGVDREHDMRVAHKYFSAMVAAGGTES